MFDQGRFNGFKLASLREPSTWRGMIMLATALGVPISPEQSDVILTAGLALAGLVGAFFGDNQDGGHVV